MRNLSIVLLAIIFLIPIDSTWALAKRKSWTVTKTIRSAEGGCCASPMVYCEQFIEYQNGECTVSESSDRYNYDSGGSCSSCGYQCILDCVPGPAGGYSILLEEDPVNR